MTRQLSITTIVYTHWTPEITIFVRKVSYFFCINNKLKHQWEIPRSALILKNFAQKLQSRHQNNIRAKR